MILDDIGRIKFAKENDLFLELDYLVTESIFGESLNSDFLPLIKYAGGENDLSELPYTKNLFKL